MATSNNRVDRMVKQAIEALKGAQDVPFTESGELVEEANRLLTAIARCNGYIEDALKCIKAGRLKNAVTYLRMALVK